jgi:hypothetical protein
MAFKLCGKAEETMNALVQAFESGKVAPAIARTVLTEDDNKGGKGRPMDNWSWNNRFFARLLLGTDDARGYKQWKQAGRQVRKGEKAGHILIPLMGKRKDEEENERTFLYGFKTCPVFSIEQTDPIEGFKGDVTITPPDYSPPEPPPLWEVAEAWNIRVTYAPFNGRQYGFCTVDGSSIGLNTHDMETWLHELGHAAESRTRVLKGGQHWDQEIVAELTSAVISEMLGCPNPGRSFSYIRAYADAKGYKVAQACLKVLSRVKDAVNLILDEAQKSGAVELLAAD